ncbi:MAG: VOC family protein [Coleofasciculus chthonoplastes F3-SA18-01]|uniref:VOC family protein n=1 Tax=Coleofasciculus chthonoplastes TaxID=64178 RepID=UPI0032FA4F0D
MKFHLHRAWVTIAATNIEPLVEFYSQLLAESPHCHSPNTYAEFQLPGLRLGLFKPRDNHRQEFEQSEQSGLSLCLDVDDLDAAIAQLSNMGYPPPGEIIVASHGREIYAYDPNGNRLILHQPQR